MPQAWSTKRAKQYRDNKTSIESQGRSTKPQGADPIFVVQHHWATADHYDFRLEIDGVLASWAVPKGPSTDPKQRRLAKQVGDHDLAHADVEGTFDHGVVELWDRGTYRNVSTAEGVEIPAADAVAKGHLSFVLDGSKISGGYSLIRTRGDNMWLLIKKKDDA